MAIELTSQETEQAIHSLRKYGAEELDTELSELRAKWLLDFLLKEIKRHQDDIDRGREELQVIKNRYGITPRSIFVGTWLEVNE